MSEPLELIENQIGAIMTAESALDGLDRIYLGVPFASLSEHDQWSVVSIDSEQTVRELTGSTFIRLYVGAIILNVRQQDALTLISERVYRVSSYATMHALANAVVELFRTSTNRALQNLSFANGGVLKIVVGEETVEYGINVETERIDAFSNSAIIPFLVETKEVLT